MRTAETTSEVKSVSVTQKTLDFLIIMYPHLSDIAIVKASKKP